MRRLKMVIPIGLLAVTAGLNAQPAEAPSAEERAQKLTDKMVEHLDLTDDQATQVHQLNLDGAKALDPYVQRLHEAQKALDDARREVMESNTAELKTILTDDQFTKFEQKKAERTKRMQEQRERCRHGHMERAEPDKR